MTTPAHAPTQKDIQARIRSVSMMMLDLAERAIERVQQPADEVEALPLTVARRQMVNLFGVPALCHRGRCRRTKLCQGEPAHCLGTCLHALPHELVARVLSVKAMRQRRRKK